MVYDCGSCVAKYVLCAFNFVIFVVATIVLGVGVWLLVDKSSFVEIAKIVPLDEIQVFTSVDVIQQASYILVAVGAFMFIISFLGYCGAMRESRWMLTLYGILLILILALEIAAGVLAITYKSKAEEETKNILKQYISHYNSSNMQEPLTAAWNALQVSLKCCGVDNYEDFKVAKSDLTWISNGYVIPATCCKLDDNKTPIDMNCMKNPTEDNSYYQTGCYDELIKWIITNLNIVIITAAVLALVELLGILFAFCLTKKINIYEK
ncbi:tetraspanin-18B-like [Rhynchophorus ferrugineus]|uniref:tetraspanin-18B-like n=1 Tax=Rhynchophorus ferrugineus TaxID=354439 RepID=UPI003FCD44EA